jgi:putative transposase
MADEGMVALRDALGKILESEHADLLREGVALVVGEVMELEASERAGAARYERSAERATYRNGYRPREWDTRVGTIELAIPKLRTGSYLPSFLNARKRSEQALLGVVMEAYTNGVSTRKVERLVEQLGVESMSKSSETARWRAPIRTCGWTRASSECATWRRGWCAKRRCWSPMARTRLAAAR